MNDVSALEQPQHIPFKELSQPQEQHLRQQIYYFTPFVRSIYQILNNEKGKVTKSINPEVISNLKMMAIYYAHAFLSGDYDVVKEQKLVDDIYKTLDKSIDELKKELPNSSENAFNKSDGWVEDHLFGSIPVDQVDSLNLPGGPDFSQGSSEGIMHFFQENRNQLIESVCQFLNNNRGNLPISIFGNVARGVLDGAFIHVGLQRKGIPSTYHFYRVSSHAVNDKDAIIINETVDRNSWGITADSFTARGHSVPLSIKMLDDLHMARGSMYLTYLGEFWKDELPVEHVGLFSTAGMLLKADLSAVKKFLP